MSRYNCSNNIRGVAIKKNISLYYKNILDRSILHNNFKICAFVCSTGITINILACFRIFLLHIFVWPPCIMHFHTKQNLLTPQNIQTTLTFRSLSKTDFLLRNSFRFYTKRNDRTVKYSFQLGEFPLLNSDLNYIPSRIL